jgi:hypothetical protein
VLHFPHLLAATPVAYDREKKQQQNTFKVYHKTLTLIKNLRQFSFSQKSLLGVKFVSIT